MILTWIESYLSLLPSHICTTSTVIIHYISPTAAAAHVVIINDEDQMTSSTIVHLIHSIAPPVDMSVTLLIPASDGLCLNGITDDASVH